MSTPSGTFHTIRFRLSCLPSICQLLIHLFLCVSIPSSLMCPPANPWPTTVGQDCNRSLVCIPTRAVSGVPRSRQIPAGSSVLIRRLAIDPVRSLLNKLANNHHARFLRCSSPSILKKSVFLFFFYPRDHWNITSPDKGSEDTVWRRFSQRLFPLAIAESPP